MTRLSTRRFRRTQCARALPATLRPIHAEKRSSYPSKNIKLAAIATRIFLLLLLCVAPASFSEAQVSKYTDLQTIRTIDPNNVPDALVDFEATVTYVGNMHNFLFVQDGKDAIFVHRPKVEDVRLGQRVRVQGRLAKGDLQPIITDSSVTIVKDGELPPAEKITDIGIEHDSRYLEFEFDILQISISLTETLLHAKTESGIDVNIQVLHPNGVRLKHTARMPGSRVKCVGVLGLQITGGAFKKPGSPANKISGYRIFCTSPSAIKIVNPKELKAYRRSQTVGLASVKKNKLNDGRFNTWGQICLIDNAQPRGMVVCDGDTFMRFDLESVYNLQPGMLLRIGGDKSTDQFSQPHLDITYLYRYGISELTKCEPMTVNRAITTYLPDRRIAVEGTPLRIERRDDQPYLIIGDERSTIAVKFQDNAMDIFASLDPSTASKVQVTGVSRPDEQHEFQLVVVRPSDASVVERKTPVSRMVAISLIVLAIGCAVAALWIKLLRNQVAQKQQFESIFDNAGCPIVVFHGDLKIINANQFAVEMTGFAKDELRRMRIDQIDTHLPPTKVRNMLVEAMHSQEVAVFRTTIQHKNNHLLNVEVHCRNLAVSDTQEKATFIAIFPDLTERNKYENQLKKARDEAIEADKAKSQFLASMSHELRTPLNGVIGMTQLLESTELTSIQADYLAACRTSGETLLTVIGDVLDFSKMEAGKLELDPQETKLIPFVESIVQSTSLQEKTQSIDLASFIDPRLSRAVMVDSDRFRQVMFNLIGNAAKFTSNGSITVSARCREVKNEHADVQFVVADTGIGIPNDRISHLFEAFEQCDSSTTREYGGTGLGLAICKQIVELMGGTIYVESTESVGSKFIVEVRLIFAKPTNASSKGKRDISNVQNRQRVAVVGMSNPIVKLLRETFIAYEVDAFFFEKHEILPQDSYDVIFWNSDGDLKSIAKQREQQPALLSENAPMLTPIVPANCDVQREEWENLGMQKPLHKPFSQTRLLQLLDSGQGDDQQARTTKVASNKFNGRALRILLCEDIPVNQMFASEICRNAGIECFVCDNGKLGVETLENDHQFDVIFMDCQMPVMDGYEATRIIRQMSKNGLIPRIPIVALTANAVAGDREKCLTAGMDDYLAKPFEIKPFLDRIHTHAATRSETQRNATAETGVNTPVFDHASLANQFNDQAFAIQIATEFAKSLPTYQAELKTCLAEHDVAKTVRVTHRLKGSAGTVKAERIRHLALEMESAARTGQLDKLEVQIVEMLQEFQNFATTVRYESLDSSVS